ncbi:MAG: J domain-containing protein [Chitinophagaceae bacterium]|nr:J domain-containing protein [Chitinophagaceae bacterium]
MAKGNENGLLLLIGAAIFLIAHRSNKGNSISGISTKGCQFFGDGKDIDSLDDLRKSFYKLSKKYHPDAGGTDADFQQLQQEYETLKYRVYQGKGYTTEEVEVERELDAVLTQIYQTIMHLPGIEIEVAGKWLWISGNTFPVKDQLKAAGLKFAPKKRMWYFPGTEYRGKGNSLNMDEIRRKYGSQSLKSGQHPHFLNGPQSESLVLLIEKMKFLLTRRKK